MDTLDTNSAAVAESSHTPVASVPNGASHRPPRGKQVRAPFVPKGKHTYIDIPVQFMTETVTKAFEKTHEPMSAGMFLLQWSYPRQAHEDIEPIDQVVDIIRERMSALRKTLDDEHTRLVTIARNEGLQGPASYAGIGEPELVRSYSPCFTQYVRLLIRLDEVIRWGEGLFMESIISSKDISSLIKRARDPILRFEREAVHLSQRANNHVGRVKVARGQKLAEKQREREERDAARHLRRAQRERTGAGAMKVVVPKLDEAATSASHFEAPVAG